jgi:DNA polymerase-3 subunit beta
MSPTLTFPLRELRREVAALATLRADSSLPICANILVESTSDGATLRRQTMDAAMTCKVPASGGPCERFTVPADRLSDILSLADGDEVELEPQGGLVALRYGSQRYQLATLPADDYPVLRSEEPCGGFSIEADALAEQVKRMAWAVPSKDHRRVLMGARLEQHGDGVRMAGTDGKRLARVAFPVAEAQPFPPVVIAPPMLAEMLRAAGNVEAVIQIVGEGRATTLTVGSRVIWASNVEGRFPDLDAVLPKGKPSMSLAFSNVALVQAVKRAAVTCDDKNKAVILTVDSDGVRLDSSAADVGVGVVTVKAEAEGTGEWAFNAAFLLDALGNTGAASLRAFGQTAPVLFGGDPALDVVLMPIKMADVRAAEVQP